MGLFSGDFGAGLVEGVAESVDQSLKSAMEKREKEMSRAREFWMTRQAQKMDLADDHDKRAGDALDAFITEFNGDVAKGLAAYKHFKTVDGAEAGLKEIEDSRAALGKFDVNDYFTFEGIDLGQFADLSRDDAFASIRAEVKPLDIQMQDTGLLSKIGLGDSDMGGKVSAQINELIPARTRTAIKGLTGAAFDRSGTITSITQKQAIESNILRGEDRLFQLSGYIASGQDGDGEIDEHDILQYQKERSQILEDIGRLSIACFCVMLVIVPERSNAAPVRPSIAVRVRAGISSLICEDTFPPISLSPKPILESRPVSCIWISRGLTSARIDAKASSLLRSANWLRSMPSKLK